VEHPEQPPAVGTATSSLPKPWRDRWDRRARYSVWVRVSGYYWQTGQMDQPQRQMGRAKQTEYLAGLSHPGLWRPATSMTEDPGQVIMFTHSLVMIEKWRDHRTFTEAAKYTSIH